jgi:hypothetical protein
VYFGDIINTLGREDHSSSGRKTYKWYKALPPADKETNQVMDLRNNTDQLCTEVMDLKELVLWCA